MCVNRIQLKVYLIVLMAMVTINPINAQQSYDGSQLWLAGELLSSNEKVMPTGIIALGDGIVFETAKEELKNGLGHLYHKSIPEVDTETKGGIVLSTTQQKIAKDEVENKELKELGSEGFIIKYIEDKAQLLITANSNKGLLYGVFHYLRLLQTEAVEWQQINVVQRPDYQKRILIHWDNLDGSVERGYAGRSIWQWDSLPQAVSPLYKPYARANASIGINGTVLNNVNANPQILTTEYLDKAKIIADQLRPYGIQVYLSVNFASPAILGNLPDSNPKSEKVVKWWQKKVSEIYTLIPDFGGFLVKANSEGQPGPMDYGCTHADGANMLADALKPYGGIVMWRAFVYNPSGNDRAKQAYDEFMPLDGQFRSNVIIQVKNGPVDFQPREPFSPLFGAMQKTAIMPELQITQEYLGFSDHWVYLGTLYHEFLQADTYAKGKGSTIAKTTDGSLFKHDYSAIAGVANVGLDNNWCGHPMAQANWYVFGRLAWNTKADVSKIAEEWVEQTVTHQTEAVAVIKDIMIRSREATVNYMTPLGLHHLMGWDHHYGPEPWCTIEGARPDWLPTYYHKADSLGIGFNRSSTGSNAVAQYFEPVRSLFDDEKTCPLEYLLWFHHVAWTKKLSTGNTLWDELCFRYQKGVDEVRDFQREWEKLKPLVQPELFEKVQYKLRIQMREAIWWHDACLLYFQQFSNRPFPDGVDLPIHNLSDLKKQKFDLKHHN